MTTEAQGPGDDALKGLAEAEAEAYAKARAEHERAKGRVATAQQNVASARVRCAAVQNEIEACAELIATLEDAKRAARDEPDLFATKRDELSRARSERERLNFIVDDVRQGLATAIEDEKAALLEVRATEFATSDVLVRHRVRALLKAGAAICKAHDELESIVGTQEHRAKAVSSAGRFVSGGERDARELLSVIRKVPHLLREISLMHERAITKMWAEEANNAGELGRHKTERELAEHCG
jgi:hypothetical protein